jgi:hypothetical protein
MNESTELRNIDNKNKEPNILSCKYIRFLYFKDTQSSLDNVINEVANIKKHYLTCFARW